MTGSILLAVTGFDPALWRAALARHAPDRSVVLDTEPFDPAMIDYAIVWKQRPSALEGLTNLKAIFSIGAGVDHIFSAGPLPDVPIVRSVADDLTGRMSEYVVWQVLDHHRKGPVYRRQQAQAIWHEDIRQPFASDVTIGIMGLGVLGTDAAEKLKAIGFQVTGWSRRPKSVDGITSHHGAEGLTDFLAASDMVVCLLPLTQDTKSILSASLFAQMKPGAVLINAGRGGLQVEADILAALDSGQISAATLDVFETEPLPTGSPLWRHPRVTVTPHAAASSMPDALVPPLIAQMDANERGEPLTNLVDRTVGY